MAQLAAEGGRVLPWPLPPSPHTPTLMGLRAFGNGGSHAREGAARPRHPPLAWPPPPSHMPPQEGRRANPWQCSPTAPIGFCQAGSCGWGLDPSCKDDSKIISGKSYTGAMVLLFLLLNCAADRKGGAHGFIMDKTGRLSLTLCSGMLSSRGEIEMV